MNTPSADGGHAQYTWELLTALSEQRHPGYRFELVSSRDLKDRYRSSLYPVHAILPPLVGRNAFSTRLSWVCGRLTHYHRRESCFLNWLQGRPDITAVHLQEWTPWLAARVVRRLRQMGKRVYCTVHNVVPHKYPLGVPRAVVDGWIRRACKLCDGLFVHTDLLADQLAAYLGEPHPPISVVPHGVWTVRDPSPQPALRERLAWKRLLFFGSIRQNKGLHVLLDAAERLPDFSITIAGQPGERSYYSDQILPRVQRLRENGIKIDLRPGFAPDEEVVRLFASHSAVVLPYTRQFVAQSGVVFMALAHELPVIASEAGGLNDLLSQFRIGQVFHEPTPEALAKAVRALYAGGAEEDLVDQIRLARQSLSWHNAAQATLMGYSRSQEQRMPSHDDCALGTIPSY